MLNGSAIEFATAWLSAWTGNNVERLISFYAPEAFYKDPANPKGLHGVKEILPYFKKLLLVNPDWIWEASEVFPSDKGFVLKWKAQIPVGNKIIFEEGMDIVEVIHGKITRNEVFFDRTAMESAWKETKKM